MTRGLQQYFPMIRTRMEVLEDIKSQQHLKEVFYGWTEEQQKEFLDFCTGVKGVKLLYDAFFKEIINPDSTPERLEKFLSLILNQNVKIRTILPNDSSRIADESSLLILDILVELEEGGMANVEVQKIGYAFPGQRSACYSADLLLRQYKRVKGEKGKLFSYRDIKKVYTIVLFEKSTREFHEFPDIYLHRSKQVCDSGMKIQLLQEYIFIPLDIFCKNQHNKGIRNEFDAWLTFLSMDEPEVIEQLIQAYPCFIPMYKEVFEMCRNTERVIGLFSKELQLLDKNTVQLMIDEMQDTIDEQRGKIDEQRGKIDEQRGKIDEQKKRLSQKEEQLSQKDSIIRDQEKMIKELQSLLTAKQCEDQQ